MNVLDAIDKPIRQLVVNINRIGLRTKFSCCGFSYENEEEPKSHAQDAFVVFKDPHDGQTFVNFLRFTALAVRYGWKVLRYHTDEWVIRFEPAKEQKEYWSKPSLHDYELYSIAIFGLDKALNDIDSYTEEFTIVDGNTVYHQMGIHWQIQPKASVTLKAFEEDNNVLQEVSEDNESKLESVGVV